MIFAGIGGLVFLIDFIVKRKAEEQIKEGAVREVAGDKILLRKLHNSGIAFGLFADNERVTVIGTAVLLGAMTAEFVRTLLTKGKTLTKLGYALLVGGGANNLYERCRQGYVTDYFSFNVKWEKLRRLVFNLSDIFIFAGTLMVLAGKLFKKKNK